MPLNKPIMKKLVFVFALMVIVGCSDKKEKIGIVDYDELAEGYVDFQEMQESIKLTESGFQSKGDSLNQLFQREGQQLQQEVASMSRRKQEERSQEFQNRVMQAQQSFQRDYQQFQASQQVRIDSLTRKIDQTINSYGEDNGYSLILRGGKQSAVLYGVDAMDVTEQVLDLLNGTEETKE